MKKFVIILMSCILGISCDSFIDLEPENNVTFTNFFKTEEDAEAVVMEIFGRGRIAFCQENYHVLMGALADEVNSSFFGAPFAQIRNLDRTAVNENTGLVLSWYQIYTVIYNCNLLLDNAYRFEISKEKLDYWLAQAYFYKGLAYFRIARDWGDAPIPANSISVEKQGRKSVNDVLDEAIDNALKALDMLPVHQDLVDAAGAKVASKQWGCKGAAAALLAHAYAWRAALNADKADWESAEKYASMIIENKVGAYELCATPEEVCTNGLVKAGKESIFEFDVNLNELPASSPYTEAYYYVGYPHNTSVGVGDLLEGFTLHVERVNQMYPKEVEVVQLPDGMTEKRVVVNDLRRDAYFYKLEELSMSDPNANGRVFMNKWRKVLLTTTAWGNTMFVNVDQHNVVWRLSDIILLRAECRARLEINGAEDDLNTIRKRASAPLYPSKYDTEGLQMAIFREREKELLGEGHRYYDVVRNGLWKTELTEAFSLLSETDVKNGALYLPVTSDAFEGNNDLMRQTPFWQNR